MHSWENCKVHKWMRVPIFSENCSFKENSNDKELLFKRKVSIFLGVHAICSLSLGCDLLINYNFRTPPMACQKCLALGLHLKISLGCKKNIIN